MEQLNQLLEVINQMKEAKKNGAEQNKEQERYYTLALLKEVYGDSLNPGILRKLVNRINKYVFDANYSLRTSSNAQRNVFGIIFECKDPATGKLHKKNLVSKVDEHGNFYSGSFSEFAYDKDDRMTKVNELAFSKDKCQELYHQTSITFEFDSDGIETKKTKIYYQGNPGEYNEADRRMTFEWERDADNFNVVHGYSFNGVIWGKTDERYFDGQIADQLYSLNDAEFERLFPLGTDLTADIEENLSDDKTYQLMPELKEIVVARLHGTTKAR